MKVDEYKTIRIDIIYITRRNFKNRGETEVDGLKQELNDVVSRLENLELDVKKFTASIQQMEEEISTQARQNSEKEEAFKVKKRTLDLLPDAENNIAKLQVKYLLILINKSLSRGLYALKSYFNLCI